MAGTGLVSQILFNKINYCCLCFNSLRTEDLIYVQDDIVFHSNGSPKTEKIGEILTVLLGDQFSDSIAGIDAICEGCTKSAIQAFIFINMCKDKLEHLNNTVEALTDCFENTMTDLDTFKTLFVSVDTKDFTSSQYYDNKVSENTSRAFRRFKDVSQEKQTKRRKERKQHNFKDESFLEICELVREKDHLTKYKCRVCLSVFRKSFNFKKHYYSQHSPKVLKCSECSKSYGSEALLKQHKYDCHSSMVCTECGKTYTNRYSLLYHMRKHTGEEPYECKLCGQKFLWSSRRAEHIRRMHMEPSIECDICHTKFKALGTFYEHRKRHFNPSSRLHVEQTVVEEVTEESPVLDWQESVVTCHDMEQ